MTHYIFERPGGLVTPADLDKNARNAYIAGKPGNPVTIKGDFRGYDYRNASIAYATVIGDWSDVPTEYTTSWASDWGGCILPPDISSYKHDFVVGVIDRKLPGLVGLNREVAQKVRDHVAASAYHSWRGSEFLLKTDLGLQETEIESVLGTLFKGYPPLMARLKKTMAGKEGELEPEDKTVPASLTVRIGDADVDLLRDPRITGREDRWAIERDLEVPGWRVHVYAVHPFPYVWALELENVAPPSPGLDAWDWWEWGSGKETK